MFTIEEELRHHNASPENLNIMHRHQTAFYAAVETHAAGRVGSLQEAAMPLYQLLGLVPSDDLNRDFINA